MQQAINNVATKLADEFIRQGTKPRKPKEIKTMTKGKIFELESVLLDQIEKLNDDSIAEDVENAKIIIDKSKAISDLASNYTEVQRLKLDVVKHLENNGGLYEKYLGIE